MYKITFVEHGGRSHTIEAEDGQTLMQAAVGNLISGIAAECGGARVCGTCHCWIDERWLAAAGVRNEEEAALLEYSEHHRPNSRLSCQVRISKALDGMVVHLPASQP